VAQKGSKMTSKSSM